MEDKLVGTFKFFIKKLTGNDNPNIKESLLKGFLKKIDKLYDLKLLGDWWVWSYLSFQFCYWSEKKTRLNGNIPANWVFGDKAIQRWKDRSDFWEYYTNLFLFKNEIEKPVKYYGGSVSNLFEVERRRFHNTVEGYFNCLSFSKYSPKSVSCLTCKFRKKCKDLLS